MASILYSLVGEKDKNIMSNCGQVLNKNIVQIKTGNPSCHFKFPISEWPKWSICQNDGTLEYNGKLYCAKHYGLLTGDADRKFLFKLCNDILDLADNGNYSNGIVYQGMDEGDVFASQMLKEYRDALSTIILESS